MVDKKTKWLVYTVLVGLIPVLARLLVWFAEAKPNSVNSVSAADFVAFGLVLHISNINEIEHADTDKSWKTAQNGISIVFIAFYGVLFTLALLGTSRTGLIDPNKIKAMAMVLSVVSLVLSYSVYDRISKLARI